MWNIYLPLSVELFCNPHGVLSIYSQFSRSQFLKLLLNVSTGMLGCNESEGLPQPCNPLSGISGPCHSRCCLTERGTMCQRKITRPARSQPWGSDGHAEASTFQTLGILMRRGTEAGNQHFLTSNLIYGF